MSVNASAPLPIINPTTPYAYLTPEAAYQTTVSLYVLSGSLAVLCWDIVDNVTNDYKLLFKHKLSLTTGLYFVSRLGTLAYAVSATIFETAPTSVNCNTFDHATNALSTLSDTTSSLLFLIRLRAIYHRTPRVALLFLLLWALRLGAAFTGPIGVVGGNIAQTRYCEDAQAPLYVFSAFVMAVVYDTLVFLAISWRLAKNAHVEGGVDGAGGGGGGGRGIIRIALWGKYLPVFTRSMLVDGQKYYLLTTISAFLTIVFASIKSVPVPLSTVFATPTLLLTNIMACRVYRNTRLGYFHSGNGNDQDERAGDVAGARSTAGGGGGVASTNVTRDMPVFMRTQHMSSGETGGTVGAGMYASVVIGRAESRQGSQGEEKDPEMGILQIEPEEKR